MTAVSRDRPTTRVQYTVTRLTDPDEIRSLLEPEKAYAAYALAQLEPRLFGLSDWYLGTSAGSRALVIQSRSGLGHALFAIGDKDALDAVLSLHPGPRFTFASLRLEHRAVIERYFLMTRPQIMLRMSVTDRTFSPVSGPAERLDRGHVTAINRLYSSEGGATAYRPGHLEEGVYYGVFEEGVLVSIAGTHVVSASEGIAVVGNVFTHPRCRGRGLATIATSAVTAHLLQTCTLTVLTVEAANDPAIAIYTRLGYEEQCTLHETPLIRKEPLGVLSAARRLAAGWRGRAEGREIVVR